VLDQQQFKKIASHWASGVAIVGAEGASGLTITSVTSLSLDPPQYLICLDQKSATLAIECEVDTIHAGGDHAIIIGNVLSAESEGGDPLVYFRGGYRELTQAI